VFSTGNSVDPAEGYRAFRGRDAGIEALMRRRGFAPPPAAAMNRPASASIGVGAMGMGIAKTLLGKGFPVFVRDIVDEREREAIGAGAKPLAGDVDVLVSRRGRCAQTQSVIDQTRRARARLHDVQHDRAVG
jgi:hypothetical protein